MLRPLRDVSVRKLRLAFEDSPPERRSTEARRHLAMVRTHVSQIPPIRESLCRDFRRAISELEDRMLGPHEQPGPKPALRRKELAAKWALIAALVFDFVVGLAIGIGILGLSPLVAIVVCLMLTVALGLIAKGVASVFVDYEHLNRSAKRLHAILLGAFVVTLACVAGLYLVRNGILPLWTLGFVTPALALSLVVTAGALSGLSEIYAHTRELFAEDQRLEHLRAELLAFEHELETAAGDEPEPPDPDYEVRVIPKSKDARSKRGNGQWPPTAAAAMALFLGLSLGANQSSASEPVSFAHAAFLRDATNTGDQSPESERIAHLFAGDLGPLTESLGDIDELAITPFSDAESVWSAGQVFPLPQVGKPDGSPESNLPGFGPARDKERDRLRPQERELRRPVLEDAARALMARPTAHIRQSCTTDAINHAEELPASTIAFVITDAVDFRCPAQPRPARSGATVCVVLIPHRDGKDVRERMQERRRAIERAYPGIVVVESYQLTGPESLRELAKQLRKAAAERGR